ncbi:hypothetical protein AKN93_02390 [Thiopseudomonas alkaliphila]|uniref:molybdenum cofactor guanylyltransferase MobA n=1 Tax=Thiopseudomonas alkaliphila TaxID=1697053 RepID=UPI00069DD95A|nr:molybdenum cofactor guanylyltransferase MobA [Thiopseudomonas alkaliphila]AKX47407.1 hypothetical protein AKN94_08610 [Thiopseudomonas alkaliphila]AKX48384.1 hypothetical protein AKN93_02390 [Thiopseudomonas alkaliphila]AKX53507.1 hypothetical protein AKN91_07350 [Thiopseudomonas alkaliphila]AKX55527.1 hypothetical protein AKN90_07260 [Thiopseudomonas alkaliphila]
MSIKPLFPQCSIVILAGGQGSRMGGQDKGWVNWRGKPMIEHIQQVVRPLTDDLIISCNRNQSRYSALADQIISDATLDFSGPMAGISQALQIAKHPLLLIVPCDSPAITIDLLAPLYQTGLTQAVFIQQGEQFEPLFSAIPATAKSRVLQLWQQGLSSPIKMWLTLNAKVLHCPAQDPRLVNFNCPELLEA